MARKILFFTGVALITGLLLLQCKKDRGVNLFTLNQDKEFGMEMKTEIQNNPDQYPLLNENDYPEAYRHLRRIRDSVLVSDDFEYRDDFVWEVYIINDDILNAFACPGGYMYFYTGLIKFLDNESQFAGVMAHEMAHVDLRHSTRQLTEIYGFDILLSIILGEESEKLTEIVAGLAKGITSLAFSRKHEYQADEYAVKFLSDTDYDPLGVAGFFEKLEEEELITNSTPAFLSTHPSPEDRVEQINIHWESEGSKEGNEFIDEYQKFKNSLPH